eukprot:scaffold1988_cov270-Prasinococcus_capsulatus_cf.AAC.4
MYLALRRDRSGWRLGAPRPSQHRGANTRLHIKHPYEQSAACLVLEFTAAPARVRQPPLRWPVRSRQHLCR